VDGGDHSLSVRSKSERTQEQWDQLALTTVSAFLAAHGIEAEAPR
jgi:hypothetical protein